MQEGYVAIAPALFQRGFEIGYTPEDVGNWQNTNQNQGISIGRYSGND